MAFSEAFEDKLMDVAAWVDENKYLNSIKDAFTVFMPFVIVGSFGTLLKALISSNTTCTVYSCAICTRTSIYCT